MRIADFNIIQKPEHHTITIRKTIDFMKEYSSFASESLEEIQEYLKQKNELVSSAPVVCFYNQELNALDVEIGYEIAKPIESHNNIQANKVPMQKVVVTIDQGEYVKQDPTLLELMQWAGEQGYEGTGAIYYYYLNDTERPEHELLTQMVIPVEKK